MKYIVEVLSPNGSGTRTTSYPSKDAAKTALDNYGYHRPGQPIIALYSENGEDKALIAVGTGTGLTDYYIIGCDCNGSNNYITNISARNVILEPIDITKLLSATGPGQDFDNPLIGYNKLGGNDRHFGWLGTSEAAWAVQQSGNNFYFGGNRQLTVQEAFDAILHGTQIDRDGIAPIVDIKVSLDGSTWMDSLSLTFATIESDPITVRVKLIVTNYSSLIGTSYSLEPSPGDTFDLEQELANGNGTCDYTVSIAPTNNTLEYIFGASNIYGSPSDTARIYCSVESEPGDNKYTVMVISNGGGTVSLANHPNTTNQIEIGTPFTDDATATPDSNHEFDKWERRLNGVLDGNWQTATVSINENGNFTDSDTIIYTAYFNELPGVPKYYVTIRTTTGGTVTNSTNSHPVDVGTSYTVNSIATPNTGYVFKEWRKTVGSTTTTISSASINETISGSENEYYTYTAYFEQILQELPQWENYSADVWHNMYTTISATKGAVLETSKGQYQNVWNQEDTTQYTDSIMSSDIDYYFPMSWSKKYDSNIEIKIPQGRSFDLYEYDSMSGRWVVHNSLFAPNGNNTYRYTQTGTVKAIYGIKLR